MKSGNVAQWIRARDFYSLGQGFESLRSHQIKFRYCGGIAYRSMRSLKSNNYLVDNL